MSFDAEMAMFLLGAIQGDTSAEGNRARAALLEYVTGNWNVYVVWDHDRAEHGEPAELLDIFHSEGAAQAYIDGDECWSDATTIEERKVLR